MIVLLVALIGVGTTPARAATGNETPRPNFVVIFCDNLGYGDIEPFGSQVHRTPHLNRMARDSAEWMEGRIAYVDAPIDATCDSVSSWPDPWHGEDPQKR